LVGLVFNFCFELIDKFEILVEDVAMVYVKVVRQINVLCPNVIG